MKIKHSKMKVEPRPNRDLRFGKFAVVGRVTPCAPNVVEDLRLDIIHHITMVHPLLPKGGEGRGEEANKDTMRASDANSSEAKIPHPDPLRARTGRGRKASHHRLHGIVKICDFKTLIHRALARGWIRRSPEPEIKADSHLRRELRARWHARGLNSHGHPRRNKPRPELTGLNRKTYHREYMKLWRKRKLLTKWPSMPGASPRPS